MLQSVTARNATSSRNSVQRNTDTSSVSQSNSRRSPQPRSLISQRSPVQTRSLRNRVNLLRQNQRPTRSNIARVPSTIPRALPPITPKASRFGDVNMPTVIEAALRRLREQAKTHSHGPFGIAGKPTPVSDLSISKARSPFSVFRSPSSAVSSISQASSSSSSSSSSEQSSSETVIQTSHGDLSSVSHSSKSNSDSKQTSSSSSSHSHSHSHPHSHHHPVVQPNVASMVHPNLMAARLNSAPGLTNIQPGVANIQPQFSIDRNSLDDSLLNKVQPAPANVAVLRPAGSVDVSPTIVQPFVPSIPRAVDPLLSSGGLQAKSVNKASSTSSKTSSETSETSNTVVSSGDTSLQSSASSSTSETKTKKTVTTKTVQETTVVKDESAIGVQQGEAGGPLPPGSITVQRGPGGVSTITLSDGSGEPVVLRASGPIKIERIVNAAGKVQFLINPIRRPHGFEREFEAEEMLNTTTAGARSALNIGARLEVPTTTAFPLPWDTTRLPVPPRSPPAGNLRQPIPSQIPAAGNLLQPIPPQIPAAGNLLQSDPPQSAGAGNLAQAQTPAFENVLSQLSEIANSISNGGGFDSGAGSGTSRADTVIQNNPLTNTAVRRPVVPVDPSVISSSFIPNRDPSVISSSFIPNRDPSVISSSFIPNRGQGAIRPSISQKILNPVQGTIPIGRTFVNPVIGSAGPVFDTRRTRNRESVSSNTSVKKTQTSSSQIITDTITSRHSDSGNLGGSRLTNPINTILSGRINAGPLPPYELRGHAQNSVPS